MNFIPTYFADRLRPHFNPLIVAYRAKGYAALVKLTRVDCVSGWLPTIHGRDEEFSC